jgi:hypothetical protein
VKQVEIARSEGGGDPKRISRSAEERSGRFDARGRRAHLSFPKAGWQRDSAGRFRARRLAVKGAGR